MDGLIVIRSITLSNLIAETRLPEGVVAKVVTWALRSVAEITLSHLRKKDGYKEPALVEGIRGSSANSLAFRRTPKMILKYY
jgi:hypothetical protein